MTFPFCCKCNFVVRVNTIIKHQSHSKAKTHRNSVFSIYIYIVYCVVIMKYLFSYRFGTDDVRRCTIPNNNEDVNDGDENDGDFALFWMLSIIALNIKDAPNWIAKYTQRLCIFKISIFFLALTLSLTQFEVNLLVMLLLLVLLMFIFIVVSSSKWLICHVKVSDSLHIIIVIVNNIVRCVRVYFDKMLPVSVYMPLSPQQNHM